MWSPPGGGAFGGGGGPRASMASSSTAPGPARGMLGGGPAVQPARLSPLGQAVMAEVKMAQLQYGKVLDLCWERCCASSDGSDSSTSATSSDIQLAPLENSCVDHCLHKFYELASVVAMESAAQAKEMTEWRTSTKIALGAIGTAGLLGFLYILFRDEQEEKEEEEVEIGQTGGSRRTSWGR
ncbi:unnamed protein product [Amoebophrya sp. A25]|nr:unnamed protein product [Amoebophrya sp. A25]|eukprot:GSA25T00012424001.1